MEALIKLTLLVLCVITFSMFQSISISAAGSPDGIYQFATSTDFDQISVLKVSSSQGTSAKNITKNDEINNFKTKLGRFFGGIGISMFAVATLWWVLYCPYLYFTRRDDPEYFRYNEYKDSYNPTFKTYFAGLRNSYVRLLYLGGVICYIIAGIMDFLFG